MTDARNKDRLSIDWTLGFRGRAHGARLPISASLELTRRCNLRCRHCYLGGAAGALAAERDTAAVLAALDEWVGAGCLYLLITGGDPMMRRDFPAVYRHAREAGMIVTVFCDGILVNAAMIELFKELPPRRIEISLYGATAETYEIVTRVPGSYARAWAGIRRLREGGIRIGLKTVLMTLNQHELETMARQAEELGVAFRYDAAIFPCLPDGAGEPLELRVAPETVVKRDMATPERRRQWLERIERAARLPESDRLYTCGAGATSFHADPFGNLSPCLMTTRYRCRPGGRAFGEVWKTELGEIRKKRRTSRRTVLSGEVRGACTHCPAFNYLETGDEERESAYVRETTLLRYRTALKWKQGIEQHHE